VNSYGPTETTVAVTMCDLRQPDENGLRQNVSIGRPILNTTAYVLDELRRAVPIGVPGELYIGWRRRRSWLPQSAGTDGGKIHFRSVQQRRNREALPTGDLVRYNSDGNIEFVGASIIRSRFAASASSSEKSSRR